MGGNAAHSNEAPPRMRWRGLAHGHPAGPPITRLPGCCPASPPGRENQLGRPVSRLSAHPPRRPGFPGCWSAGLQLISILGGAEFLSLTTERRKDFRPGIYGFYCYEHLFHIAGLVIPRGGRLSTGSSTAWSTAGAVAGQLSRRGLSRPGAPLPGGSAARGGRLPGEFRCPGLCGPGPVRVSWSGGVQPARRDRDPAIPRRPGRGSCPGRFRCGPWSPPERRDGAANCPAGPGRAPPPAGA